MKNNETGAGQVGLLWVVFLIVIILGLAGFTYIAFKDKANVDMKYQEADKKEKETFRKFQEVGERVNKISEAVGFRGDSPTAPASVESINEKITTMKEKFGGQIPADTKTLELVITGIVAAHGELDRQLADVRKNFEQELELRRKAEENVNQIQSESNRRITELEAQLNDEQQRAQTQLEEDNQRISNLQTQLDEAEGRVREAENRVRTLQERFDKEKAMLVSRISAQAKKLEVLKEPELPDGSIISTSSGSDLAYIDIGRLNGLRRGTKFEVFRYGKGGVLEPKGWIEVREVEKDSALCGIIETRDSFDPIIKGDVIANPHFARNMTKTFVFLGEFPASMNKEFVKERLVSLGAQVAEKVSSDTDFLVLGEKERTEYAPELSDLPEYKLASQLGVQVIRLKALADYIAY